MGYHKMLQRVMQAEADSDSYAEMSVEALTKAIAAISERMKGPMSNTERLFESGIRRGMQAELARRAAL